jgi:hypothetical protein
MNLYLVERTDHLIGYYDARAFVCVAGSEQEARHTHPLDDKAEYNGETWSSQTFSIATNGRMTWHH